MGGPRALLATDLAGSREWRDAFIRTYLERDLPQLGINLPAITQGDTLDAFMPGGAGVGSTLCRLPRRGRALSVVGRYYSDPCWMPGNEAMEAGMVAMRTSNLIAGARFKLMNIREKLE